MLVNQLSLNIHPGTVGQANGCREQGWTPDSVLRKLQVHIMWNISNWTLAGNGWKGRTQTRIKCFACCQGAHGSWILTLLSAVRSPSTTAIWSSYSPTTSKWIWFGILPLSVREPQPLYYILQNTYYHGPFQNRFLTSNLIWYLWHFCDIRGGLFSSFSHVKKSEPRELILNNPLPDFVLLLLQWNIPTKSELRKEFIWLAWPHCSI